MRGERVPFVCSAAKEHSHEKLALQERARFAGDSGRRRAPSCCEKPYEQGGMADDPARRYEITRKRVPIEVSAHRDWGWRFSPSYA